MASAKVLIIYTGGTIGMLPEDDSNPASPLVPAPLSKLRPYVPALQQFKDDIQFGENSPFGDGLDSSDVKPEHWIKMAEIIKEEFLNYDGFVILHGTDTMAYTASGLSFIIEKLAKPVVVTGSQLPISHPRTDAVRNFTNAIYLAAYKYFDLPRIPEVVICFDKKILRGNRATKTSSNQMDGFDSLNFPPLGTLGEHITIRTELLLQSKDPNVTPVVNQSLSDKVISVDIFPGFRASHLKKLIEGDDIDGVVINTFGAGNAPGDNDLLDVIKTATAQNKVILNITQCGEGMVEMGRYAASSGLLERGVASGLDMTREASMAKLMLNLEKTLGEDLVKQLQVNQRGEQTENLFDLRYHEILEADATNTHFAVDTPDSRFSRERLSKAIVRISQLRVVGAENGETIAINVFVNKADAETPRDSPHCIASFSFVWEGKPRILLRECTDAAKNVVGTGSIPLCVVSENPQHKFHHKGLYLALFSKSDDRRLDD